MPGLTKVTQRRAAAKVGSAGAPLSPALDETIARLPYAVRREARRLVRRSPRLGELALVFPGALFALATQRGPAGQRLKAVSLIEQGAPLKAVARALGLPLWLKKLPPEAFQLPLGELPLTETFARRISARLPRDPSEAAFWLETVAFAHAAAGEDFAVWLAEQPLYCEPGDAPRVFAVLATYAWFSTAVLTRGHSLIVVPWRPGVALDTAVCAAKSWLNRVRLVCQLGPGVIIDTWLEGGEALGYTFAPLIEQRGLLDEAHAMQNCADQYSERLSRERCRLFSIAREGVKVATMEIGPHPRETGVLAIVQLKARHNMPAPVEVWQAAHAWMASQRGLKRQPSLFSPERPFDAEVWRQLMQPYRVQRRGAAWIPEQVSAPVIAALDLDMADLARRAGVTSWLFT